jgi:replication-associated recombination protein RarA
MLMQDLRPLKLKDIIGQESVVKYFQAVLKEPVKAHKNYVIVAPWGTGKTTLTRSFARELFQVENLENTNYLEIDSFQIKDKSYFENLKNCIYQQFNGYKIICLDEVHLISKDLQGGLLKIIEENRNNIFFFFLTTERQGILDTIVSRSLEFSLSKLSDKEMQELFDTLIKPEYNFSVDVFQTACVYAQGSPRNFLNQIEIVIMLGEEEYTKNFKSYLELFDIFFTSGDKKIVDLLIMKPLSIIESLLDYFMLDIIRNKKYFIDVEIIKLFTFYLKMKRYIQSGDQFYSFLFLLFDFKNTLRRK